jgi:hypothetical protein
MIFDILIEVEFQKVLMLSRAGGAGCEHVVSGIASVRSIGDASASERSSHEAQTNCSDEEQDNSHQSRN